jgi:hypothetical protein
MPHGEGTLSFRLHPSALSKADPRLRCSLLLGTASTSRVMVYETKEVPTVWPELSMPLCTEHLKGVSFSKSATPLEGAIALQCEAPIHNVRCVRNA